MNFTATQRININEIEAKLENLDPHNDFSGKMALLHTVRGLTDLQCQEVAKYFVGEGFTVKIVSKNILKIK